ncbi:MAG: tetratricopeptide repeat protein [Candidatus Dadabacteria bacterium]
MAEVKHARQKTESEVVVERARDFWTRYGKIVTIISAAIIVIVGGYLFYKNFVKAPQEKKAAEAMFRAEEFFRSDSLKLAVNGDGMNPGFEKIISQYGGTAAGNLAKFYAGSAYLKLGDYNKAVKYLKDFNTDAKQVEARKFKLLGDAYAEQGKNSDALDSYKKSAHEFEDDEASASEALFMAAYLADRVMKDKKQAIDLYKELKKKYSRTQYGFEADKYLAQAGVYTED